VISSATRARRLVGRTKECAFFEARTNAALRGHGAVVVLSGEAGSGKTRLQAAWRAIAESRGFAVSSAQNYAFARTPYASIVETLTPLLAREPRAFSPIAQERALLERILSSSVAVSAEAQPQPSEKRRLFATVGRALGRIATIGPLAIFIDDGQWMDGESLEVVQYLARACGEQRSIIVLAARAEARERSASFDDTIAALDRLDCAYRVTLGALADEHVRELIMATAPATEPLSQRAIAAICRLSDGNPLFVEDLVRHALARNAPGELLPESIEQSVRRRVDALGEAGREYLEIASAIGATFDSTLLADLGGVAESEITPVLRRARDVDLIVADEDRPGRFRFRHELTRVAVYAGNLPSLRRAIHRRVAVALEDRRERTAYATLAWHWDRAGDRPRAARYAIRAGEAEVARHAYVSAREHFELALSEPSLDDDLRCGAEETLGQIALALGEVAEAAHFFQAALDGARRLRDRALVIRALLGLQHAKARMEDLDAALTLADEAIALVDPKDPRSFECLSVAAVIATFQFLDAAPCDQDERGAERAAGYIARARTAPRTGTDLRSELRVLNCEAKLAIFRGDAGLALRRARACAELGGSAESPSDREMALTYFVWTARELAAFSEIVPAIGNLIAATDESGDSFAAATSRGLAAQTCHLLGDIGRARELMYGACALGVAWPRVRLQLAVYGIPIALAADDMLLLERAAAPELLEEILAGEKILDMEQVYLAKYLDLAAARGDDERLRQLMNFAVKGLPAMVNHHAILVPLARYAGDDVVESVATLLPREDGTIGFLALYRSIARAAIAKRRGDPAAQRLSEIALSRARRAHSPILEALAHEVTGNLRDALDIYRSIGAAGDVRRLEPQADSAKRAISRREREIAELAGLGLSNRVIGERLSISDRTVEHHIASVFNKLGLRSRAELMAYVIRSTDRDEPRTGESLH
jgi:DNA-binding CsgD family transcriptional regulator